MTKKSTLVLTSILGMLILSALIYYCGFSYSFKNYGEHGNWKPIKAYEIQASKINAEQSIRKMISDNSTLMWFADSNYQFSKDGWFTTFIKANGDTVEYIYRFKGDKSSWTKENKSIILLFSITDKYNDITPTTIENVNKKQIQIKLLLFESALINEVKRDL